jgi:DNA replication initiation complex subunit (GINS family)
VLKRRAYKKRSRGEGMTEVLTYDALREIQYNERKSEKLYELDNSFYTRLEEYFDRKGPKNDLAEMEMRNAKNILKDILDRRERKILSQALTTVRSGMRIDTTTMTGKEEELFKKLVRIIKKHREEAIKPVKKTKKSGTQEKETPKPENEEPTSPENKELENEKIESEPQTTDNEPQTEPEEPESDQTTTYIKVKILEELPEIVGSDFKNYGPFKNGDIIDIPEKNADIFIEKNKAEKIE